MGLQMSWKTENSSSHNIPERMDELDMTFHFLIGFSSFVVDCVHFE